MKINIKYVFAYRHMVKILWLIPVMTAIVTNGQAQTDSSAINKSVTVTRDYNPELMDAEKIPVQPETDRITEKKQSFTYTSETQPFRIPLRAESAEVTEYGMPEKQMPQQNYITGGVGTYNAIFGEMFLNAYKSDVNTLSFLAATDNSFANLKLADGTKSKAYESDSKLKTFYQHYFDQGTLTGYAAYRYTGFRYYGQSTLRGDSLMPLSLPYATTTKPVRASELLNGTKPAYALFETGLSYGLNSENKHEETPFIGLYYSGLNHNAGLREHIVTLRGRLLQQGNSGQFGLKGEIGSAFYGNVADSSFRNYTRDNFVTATLSPYYRIQAKNRTLKAGANLFAVFPAGENPTLLVTPQVAFDFDLIKDKWFVHLEASGEINPEYSKDILSENPFVTADFKAEPERKPLITKVGLSGYFTPRLSLDLQYTFGFFENKHFFVNQFYTAKDVQGEPVGYSNLFDIEERNGREAHFIAGLNYSGKNFLNAGSRILWHHYNMEHNGTAWHLPKVEFESYLGARLNDKLVTNINLNTSSGREVKTNISGHSVTLPVMFRMGLDAKYTISSRMSAGVTANNLLNSNYDVWYGYPAKGFQILVGLTYRF